jgi:hypothetical protein
MADDLELLPVPVRPARTARLGRGRHVAALLAEMQAVAGIARRYRAASHLSTERARRRVLAACRIVLAAVPGDGKRQGRKFQSLEIEGGE